MNKILNFSLCVNAEDEKAFDLQVKFDSTLRQLRSEKDEQLNKVDEKFKVILTRIKDKYKQVKAEINEVYDKTEKDIKMTFKGMTWMINSIGKSIKEVVGYMQGSQK